jgi:hypothetical protein
LALRDRVLSVANEAFEERLLRSLLYSCLMASVFPRFLE